MTTCPRLAAVQCLLQCHAPAPALASGANEAEPCLLEPEYLLALTSYELLALALVALAELVSKTRNRGVQPSKGILNRKWSA